MSRMICASCAASGFTQEIINAAHCYVCHTSKPVQMEAVEFEPMSERRVRALQVLGIMSEPVQAVASTPRETQAARTCRVRAMRAAFKTAQTLGYHTQDVEKMRGAIARYFGKPCVSRRDLSSGQWCEFTAALELGVVAF